jgi:hypothetical protein
MFLESWERSALFYCYLQFLGRTPRPLQTLKLCHASSEIVAPDRRAIFWRPLDVNVLHRRGAFQTKLPRLSRTAGDYSRDLRPGGWGSDVKLHGSNSEPLMSALGH